MPSPGRTAIFNLRSPMSFRETPWNRLCWATGVAPCKGGWRSAQRGAQPGGVPNYLLHRVRQPGLGRQALRFVGLDLVLVAQGQADVVEAVEQAVLAERLHIKCDFLALRFDDDLPLQVDG